MDEDDIILTTMLYLDEFGKVRRWCNQAERKMLPETILSPEGNIAVNLPNNLHLSASLMPQHC